MNDRLYGRVFNENTSAAHVVFVFALHRAVERRKLALSTQNKRARSSLTKIQQKELLFYVNRGATFLMTAAVASCVETFLDRSVPNVQRLSFGLEVSPGAAQTLWEPLAEVTGAFCSQLEIAFTDGRLKSNEHVPDALETFQSLVQSTADANRTKYQKFALSVR